MKKLRAFYSDLLTDIRDFPSVAAHLQAIALRMYFGVQNEVPAIFVEISNYHPSYLGKSVSFLAEAKLTKMDCSQTIASEYGFMNWETLVSKTARPYDLEFERAVDALLEGKLNVLENFLAQNKRLIHQKSPYGHGATLLHYCGSNGVEMWRQIVPNNLPETIEFLLSSGADKSATMTVYGGEFTPLQLLETSVHPIAAGVFAVAREALK